MTGNENTNPSTITERECNVVYTAAAIRIHIPTYLEPSCNIYTHSKIF